MAYLTKCSRCGSFYWLDPEAPVTGICPTCRAEDYEGKSAQQPMLIVIPSPQMALSEQSNLGDSWDWCPNCHGFGSQEWNENAHSWVLCKRCGGLGVVQQADTNVVYERLCDETRTLRKMALAALDQFMQSNNTPNWEQYIKLSQEASEANEREVTWFNTHIKSH
jgi:hypothetical protein